jgi:hypothetical protein
MNSNKNYIIFPRPFAFAIDDLGWNTGTSSGDGKNQGPSRIGIDRKMDIDDYKCIVEVAKQVGVRIQGLFVLAEMDRENILAKFPTTTWMGKDWDNAANKCQENIDIVNFVKENSANIEFGLHGVGHEYWINGVKKRAEWYCTDNHHPWPEKSSIEHLQCFKDIMAQYKLSPEYGHSFPESFVPCAYGYYWNPTGEYSTGSIMSKAGIKFANTQFDYIPELNPPKGSNGGGFDQGVIVVNRINYGNDWYQIDALPILDISKQESDIIESHWSNWLAQDGFLQAAVNQKWVDYYKMVQSTPDRYAAKNTEQFFSQWLYKKNTKVSENKEGTVFIDNTQMPDEAYKNNMLGNMVLKIKLDSNQHISHAKLKDENIACCFEDQGYGFIYLPMLEKRKYTLEYKVGSNKMDSYIFNKGTYNVYSYLQEPNSLKTRLRLYGTQEIDFYGTANPKDIIISNKSIELVSSVYYEPEKHLVLTLKANDFQGENGMISLVF